MTVIRIDIPNKILIIIGDGELVKLKYASIAKLEGLAIIAIVVLSVSGMISANIKR